MPDVTPRPSGPRVDAAPTGAVHAVTLPPYGLHLHNDESNTMVYVVRTLLACVPELNFQHAASVMVEAHVTGSALVITCPLERAELYAQRLTDRGLTVTIERV